ncbi:hypothetical protein [Kitasatospora sp. NPDC056181]|uniref:hypothetical protein n=1 Tax=Kitasatospora sp. NPDC056181 TaxID=3345737 RepID=UPI0035DEB47A
MPPNVPNDILDEFRQLKQEVRDAIGRGQIRPAMNQVLAGNVVIGQGGTLRVDDVDGSPLFYVGKLAVNNPDGSEQRGLVLYRDDGTPAIQLRRTTLNPADPQGLVMIDAHGKTMLAEDVVVGGLAYPRVPLLPPTGVDIGRWPWTDQPGWTTIADCFNIIAQPQLAIYVRTGGDVGTVGQVRVLVNGAPWGPTVTAGAANIDYAAASGVAIGSQLEVEIQAQRTSGTGRVYANCFQLYGLGS